MKTILILLAIGLSACEKKPTTYMRTNADCEMRLQAYMKDHGHEGTATRQQKEDAFREAYWKTPTVIRIHSIWGAKPTGIERFQHSKIQRQIEL